MLGGDLTYHRSEERLPADEERFVLLAMHKILVERGLCLREHTDTGTMLIFPSYYRRERHSAARRAEDNSPAIYRWVCGEKGNESRQGRKNRSGLAALFLSFLRGMGVFGNRSTVQTARYFRSSLRDCFDHVRAGKPRACSRFWQTS